MGVRDRCMGLRRFYRRDGYDRFGEVVRRKEKERFCGRIGNWVRGIDKDYFFIVFKECVI